MNKNKWKYHLFVILALVFGLSSLWPASVIADPVSKPGEYSGYSEPIYSEWVRSSEYVEVRDGTLLAVDIYRPSVNGVAVDTPYPVVWEHTPYRRAYKSGSYVVLGGKSYADDLCPYGYVVAVVDTRGMGASYGTRRGMQDRTEAWDAFDITEWFASQPWCDGQVGMWGCSYNGGSVYQAVTTMPPHLKAVLPGCSDFDKWEFVRRGGILAQFNTRPDDPVAEAQLDLQRTLPVDDDTDGNNDGYPDMLYEATQMHQYNDPMADIWKSMPYRDSVSEGDLLVAGSQFWLEVNPSTYIDETNNSNAAFYHWGSFHDNGRLETIMNFINVTQPDKILLSPEGHCNAGTVNIHVEHLRFYDYWLKGINNGVMEEPPIYYYKMGPPEVEGWQYAWAWPLPNEKRIKLFLNGGPSGSGPASVNDGGLSLLPPPANGGSDAFDVDFDFTGHPCAGLYFLWEPCVIDDKGLTYTTAPLEKDVEVTGHPVVHLWVSSTATDGNFFVYLEDVSPDGEIGMISHGRLRASYRKLNEPPHNNLGLPWHRSFEEDNQPLVPGEPVEMVLDLLPTSQVFAEGHRMRLTIAGADPREREIEVITPTPEVSVYHSKIYKSYIELPITTKPISPKVQVKPGILNLKSKGLFTVFITPPKGLPDGYRADDIDLGTVTCGGAPAVWGEVAKNTLIAKFKREDLTDISDGHRVTLTVQGKYQYDIPFEGKDRIWVIR